MENAFETTKNLTLANRKLKQKLRLKVNSSIERVPSSRKKNIGVTQRGVRNEEILN